MADINKDIYDLVYSESFALSGIEEEDINLTLSSSTTTSATIYGTITNDTIPLDHATIKIYDSNGVPYRHTRSDENGTYTIDGIALGSYHVGAVKQGYLLSALQSVTLTDCDSVGLDFTLTSDSTLSLGVIAGTLYDENLDGLSGGKLFLSTGSSETHAVTYSIDDGEFLFYDLVDGTYTLSATAEGYLPCSSTTVTVSDGSITTLTVSLEVDTTNYCGTVSGRVKNDSGTIVSGCFVGLYEVSEDEEGKKTESLVAFTKTNSNGLYLFGEVSQGTYLVKAKMSG